MGDGCGSEYLEFSFGSVSRRVSYVGVCIPPMPYGPLSVRHFHIEAAQRIPGCDTVSWKVVSEESLRTLDEDGLQEFGLDPPLDTTTVRLVCTLTAARACNSRQHTDCVGLFQVAFE